MITLQEMTVLNSLYGSLAAKLIFLNYLMIIKRMRTIGLPDDLVGLVEVWLKDRCFYVYLTCATCRVNFPANIDSN